MISFIFAYIKNFLASRKISDQRGFSLLEYAAGAVIILGVLWGVMNGPFKDGFVLFFENVGTWLTNRANSIT